MVTESKKKKKITGSLPGVNVTCTTGDPFLNATHFNKDAVVQGDEQASAIVQPVANAPAAAECAAMTSDAGANAEGGMSGGCAESLTEDKMFACRVGVEVELPPHTHIVDENLIKAAIKKVAPEEEFNVGYVTPVYFYKDLWDKFTLFKYTEMRGWTGEDYIEARADTNNSTARIELANKQAAKADAISSAAGYADHETDDGGIHNDRNPRAHVTSDYSAVYTLVNKIVAQAKGETLLFYPVVGSKPRVIYYMDMKDGNGPVPVAREVLEDVVYKKVLQLAQKKDIKEKYVNGCTDKVRKMLAIDSATIAAVTLDQEDRYETRSRFDNNFHTEKPQVRALYLNQIYYLSTKDKTLGASDPRMAAVSESLERNLTEKRETKRYYIRPQNIFCANKADVLKGLIEVADSGENCTVYSLKNLSDHDDVHQLTNHDIIYYYDNNVLYDKNHVLVMDYDLFIKHEEERKKINKDPVALTKQDYDQNYEDRMTKETVTENLHEGLNEGMDFSTFGYIIHNVSEFGKQQKYIVARFDPEFENLWYYGAWDDEAEADACAEELNSYHNGYTARVFPNTNLSSWDKVSRTFKESCKESLSTEAIPFEAFKLAIERGEEVDLGINQADVDKMFVNDDVYSDTVYITGKDNNGYYIATALEGNSGEVEEGDTKYYDSFDELVNAIQAVDWSTGELLVELPTEEVTNPFDQTFEAYDIFGNRLTEAKEEKEQEVCCICGEPIEGYGNNAEPYKHGKCCDACNFKFVIPARLNIVDTAEEAKDDKE